MKPSIEQFLESQGRTVGERVRRRQAALFWLVVVGGLQLFVVLDYFVMFSPAARFAALASLAALAAWRLAAYLRTRAVASQQVAQSIEQQSDGENVVLSTAADERVRAALAEEPEVGEHLQQQLDGEAWRVVRNAGPLRPVRLAPWMAALALVFFVAAVFTIRFGGTGYARILTPWTNTSYTRIVIEAPSEPIPAETPFRIQGQLRGRKLRSAVLHNSLDSQTIAIHVDAEGRFEVATPGAAADVRYWVSAGDGQSEKAHVKIFLPVEVAHFQIQVRPPAYAAHLARTIDKPNFEVLRGGELDYHVTLSRPAKSVQFVWLDDEGGAEDKRAAFKPTADPLGFRLPMGKLPERMKYRLAITNTSGEVSQNEEPYQILTLADAAPKLTITGHDGEKVFKQGGDEVAMNVKATDDVGLDSLRLVYRKIGKPGESKSVPLNDQHPLRFTAKSLLDLAPLELQPADLIVVYAEGQDGNILDGPGVGKSQIVMLEVPEPPQEDAGGGDGGGGSGGQVINPLELQKSLLRDTSKLSAAADAQTYDLLYQDQQKVNGFVDTMLENVTAEIASNPQAAPLAAQLQLALSTMNLSASQLNQNAKNQSVLAQEFAVATLTRAAQMMGGPS